MPRLIVFLGFLLAIFNGNAQEDPTKIQWLTWQEAVERCKTEPKHIFVDVYTEWCGWCKKMDASTFKDPAVVQAMNEYFYAVKLDAERKDTVIFNGHTFVNINPEAKRGVHTLASSMLDNQMTYPSFVIIDGAFNRQHVIKGYQKVPEMLGTLLFFGTNQNIRYLQRIQQELSAQPR